MKQIDIEDDLYKYILANIEAFGETPSEILRRLLDLPAQNAVSEIQTQTVQVAPIEPAVTPEISLEIVPKRAEVKAHAFAGDQLPQELAGGIAALFESENFQNEAVITNKFKMMLTTMYYENKKGFIEAAKVAKGRSRDYLGVELDELLASPNQDEVDQLIASKPRAIPYTPYWVVTNANTGRKRIILTQVMASMGYPHSLIERIKHEI